MYKTSEKNILPHCQQSHSSLMTKIKSTSILRYFHKFTEIITHVSLLNLTAYLYFGM